MSAFQTDAYTQELTTTVRAINDRGGLILDDTIFYPTGGGQPGDSGVIRWHENGQESEVKIATTVKDRDTGKIVHVPAGEQPLPQPGETVSLNINWENRYLHMRMHTALHLLCAAVPCGVTGGQIGAEKSRLDFDIGETVLNKVEIEQKLNQLINDDHPVTTRWISEQELDDNPELVRTLSVQPPRGAGKIRLLQIGDSNSIVDLQPCGGTHVRSTAEIGTIKVGKIENKGKRNRRVNLLFAQAE